MVHMDSKCKKGKYSGSHSSSLFLVLLSYSSNLQFLFYLTFLFFFNLVFNWSIISLQCYVIFFCITTFIPFFSFTIILIFSFKCTHQRNIYQNKIDTKSISSVQSLRHVGLFATPWTAALQASLSITTNSQSLFKPMATVSVIPFNHLVLCGPLLLPSVFASIRVFSNESILCIRFSISPSSEHSGLISFRMNLLDLLAVQGTLKSLLQHYSSKASTLWRSAFFMVWLSHPYMTTGKAIPLTRRNFVDKVMSLLFNMPSRFVVAFLPRSKSLFDVRYLKSYIRFLFPSKRQVLLASSK